MKKTQTSTKEHGKLKKEIKEKDREIKKLKHELTATRQMTEEVK